MTIKTKIFILLFSLLAVQNSAYAYDKNSEKVTVNVSVDKSQISVSTSPANNSASISSQSSSSLKGNTKNNSTSNNYGNDSSDANYKMSSKKNKKIINWQFSDKFDFDRDDKIIDTVNKFKNNENLNIENIKKLDSLINQKIKEMADKINLKFYEDDKINTLQISMSSQNAIERLEKKAEIVDYVQKTFEVMGIIN